MNTDIIYVTILMIMILVSGLLLLNLPARAYSEQQRCDYGGYYAIGSDGRSAFIRTRPAQFIGPSETDLGVSLTPQAIPSKLIDSLDTSINIRLCDISSGDTIPHTTYEISITNVAESGNSQQPFIDEIFHSHNGSLTLILHSSTTSKAANSVQIVNAQRNPSLLNAAVADGNNTVNVTVPNDFQGGMLHVRIQILGAFDDKIMFTKDDAPRFDEWLYQGIILPQSFKYDGKTYNATIISYFSREIEDFNFKSSTNTFFWSIPFNWEAAKNNMTGLDWPPNGGAIGQILYFPKSFGTVSSTDTTRFNVTINGHPLSPGEVSIEPYASNSTFGLHVFPATAKIQDIAMKLPSNITRIDYLATIVQQVPEFSAVTVISLFVAVGILCSIIFSRMLSAYGQVGQ